MMHLRSFLLGFLVSLGLCATLSAEPKGVNLAAMQAWDIVVAQDAIPSETYAAEEFANHFALATGTQLPIVTTVRRPIHHIFIGASEAMRVSNVGFETSGFGPEDLRIVIREDNIAIAGGRPRGTLYGVYQFLEDYLGVRFLTAEHTYVPKVPSSRIIKPEDRFYHPPLSFRWSYYGETNNNPVFATRLRNNAVTGDPKLGGKTPQILINHSFGRLIPSSKYGKEHPEYYAEVNGKRLSNVKNDWVETQPCLTNPDVLRIVTDGVLKILSEQPDRRNVSVSQNDNANYCRCPKCRAIDEREGTPMGSLLTFVNAVADEVAKSHPNVMVGTLAYWYSRRPPKTIKPRPNVQIQLCSIECCMIHPINDPNCPKNVQFCRDLADWAKICKNIYIWNYNVNFSNYLLPCPNLRVIEPNIRYFVANNAKGVFMQAAGNAMGAEFSDLRNYIISNLLWDPSKSGKQLMDEFLDLHYGKAAPPIRRFINLVHNHAEKSGIHPRCFGKAADFGIDEKIARAGLEAFEVAMDLAENEKVRRRVEKASICAYRAAIEPVWYLSDKSQLDPVLAKRMRPLVSRFFKLCGKYGVTRASEGTTIEAVRQRLERVFNVAQSGGF